MRLPAIVILSLFIHLNAFCQDTTLLLWPAGKIPNSRKSDLKEQVQRSNITWVTNVQEPNMTVFLPSRQNATGMALVICPGGGYGGLAYDWEGTDIAKWLNANGIAAIVLKYRLPNPASSVVTYKTPLMDAQRAMRLVRYHADEWKIKKDKVGIIGFSAGGHLASTVGTHFNNAEAPIGDAVDTLSARPDFMILMYPVITMSKPFMHKGSADNLLGINASQSLREEFSNEMQVTKETPPTILVQATDDNVVPVENSLSFYQALKDNNVPAELHIYPKGGHGFSLAIGKGYLSTWPDRVIDWLKNR
jgi:acetyl esterase/lipase